MWHLATAQRLFARLGLGPAQGATHVPRDARGRPGVHWGNFGPVARQMGPRILAKEALASNQHARTVDGAILDATPDPQGPPDELKKTW